MMRKDFTVKSVSVILLAATVIGCFSGCADKPEENTDETTTSPQYVQQEYSAKAENVNKEETVYINMNAQGEIYKVSVTDWLHTNTPQVRATDKSDLDGIYNINTLLEPVRKNGTLFWDMDTTDLYYSGSTEKMPPVTFSIKYFLDGSEISTKDIVGKSGNVKIQITVNNSLKKEITVDNKKYSVSCPMLALGGTILPESAFSNISIDYGTALSDGSKQIVFFGGIPGMEESLGLSELNVPFLDGKMVSDTYTISAYTECFELGNMMFAVVPLSSLGSFGNSELTQSMDGIQEILTDVKSIQAAIESLDLQSITDILYGDAARLENIMKAIEDASALYEENEKMIKVLSGYATRENLEKLDKLITDLNNTDLEAIGKRISDPQMKALLSYLANYSEDFADLAVLIEDIEAVMPIIEELTSELNDPEIQQSIENLPQTLNRLKEIISIVNENRELMEMMSSLTSDDSNEQLQVITNAADKYSSALALSPEQLDVFTQRLNEWIAFGNSYDIFTQKDESMTSSVMFTYKSDAITAA